MIRRPTTAAKMLMRFRHWIEPFACTNSFNLPHRPAKWVHSSHLRKLKLQAVDSLAQDYLGGQG